MTKATTFVGRSRSAFEDELGPAGVHAEVILQPGLSARRRAAGAHVPSDAGVFAGTAAPPIQGAVEGTRA